MANDRSSLNLAAVCVHHYQPVSGGRETAEEGGEGGLTGPRNADARSNSNVNLSCIPSGLLSTPPQLRSCAEDVRKTLDQVITALQYNAHNIRWCAGQLFGCMLPGEGGARASQLDTSAAMPFAAPHCCSAVLARLGRLQEPSGWHFPAASGVVVGWVGAKC